MIFCRYKSLIYFERSTNQAAGVEDFAFFFREGIYHITDLRGYDHILFITALCLPYSIYEWKKILILVTAFTIGHSITLALSVFDRILIPSSIIEFLIPVTIAITALENIFVRQTAGRRWRYLLALIFGLIHGMGFSNYLRSMIGRDESIVTRLLAFNVGLEAGQLIIVLAVLALIHIFVHVLKAPSREFLLFTSGGLFALAVAMAIERAAAL